MSKEKTYVRECQQSITLMRDGKRVELTTGQKFAFNQEEYDQLMESNPGAVSAKGTVDLDSGDVDLKKVEGKQTESQTNPPADPAAAAAAAAKTGKGKKVEDEL